MRKKNEIKSTSLHQAVLSGDIEKLKIIAAKDEASFNEQLTTKDANDNLPLDRACPRGHYEIVKLLIEAHKKPGNKYVMHNKQNYYPFLSAVRWYFKVLDDSDGLTNGKFNTGTNCSRDYMNIIQLLAKEYPEHTTISDNKGCNALVYAINHFNNACHKNDTVKIEKIKRVLEFLISIKVPVQEDKLYYKTWDRVAPIITAMKKKVAERENINPQNIQVDNNLEKKNQFQGKPPINTTKPTFFSTQQKVQTTGRDQMDQAKKYSS